MPLPSDSLQSNKNRAPHQTFAKACKILLIVWLFGVFVPLNLFWENHTEHGASRKWALSFPNADFSQYYLAGAAARHGLWDHLYPRFKSEWASKPGRRIWSSDHSSADPELLKKVSGLPKWYVENVAPPPQALFFMPFGLFSFFVAFKIWMTGLVLATFGTIICAVKIYRKLGGASGYVEGALYLSGVFLPLLPRIGAGDNAMMLLVLCIGIAALSWERERPFSLAYSLIIPAVFKGLTASWCPLLLIRPIKWRTLAWMIVWTLLLNGLVLYLGGVSPYNVWIKDVLPNAQSMEIQQFWRQTMNVKGIAYKWGWESFPAQFLNGFHLAGLLALYFGFWKKRNIRGPEAMANLCASMVGALVLFNVFNAISWLPYITFLLPFSGWAVLEYNQSSQSEKKRITILAGILFLLIPLVHLLFSRFILRHSDAATDAGRDLYVAVEILFLVLAYRRLFCISLPPCQNREGKPDTLIRDSYAKPAQG